MKTYTIRYAGDYGFSLYGRYADEASALAALRDARRCALAWGNAKLAASFELS